MNNKCDQIDEYDESDRFDDGQQERLDKFTGHKLLANLYYNKAISLANLYRIDEAAKLYDMASNVKFISEEFYYKVLRAKAIMYSDDAQEYKALEIYEEIINQLEQSLEKENE